MEFYSKLPFVLLTLMTLEISGSSWNADCGHGCQCLLRRSPSRQQAIKTLECHGRNVNLDMTGNYTSIIDVVVLSRIPSNELKSALESIANYPRLSEVSVLTSRISNLNFLTKGFSQVVRLTLNFCGIVYIKKGAFETMKILTYLSLSGNGIASVHSDGFKGLSKLLKLDLSLNRLDLIDNQIFKDLVMLEELDLSQNIIQTIPSGIFKFIPDLRKLVLNKNQIKTISHDGFDGLVNLKLLDLRNNSISAVPTEALKTFKQIDVIDMSHNYIEVLTGDSFSNVNVTTLKLNKMDQLKCIRRKALKDLSHLNTLEISDNHQLRYIDPEALENVPKLKKLTVSGNQLIAFEKRTLLRLPSLRVLGIVKNPLNCDCNLYWVLDEMIHKTLNITFLNSNDLTCLNDVKIAIYLQTMRLSSVEKTCAPSVIPFFNDKETATAGTKVSFYCRAVGIPTPEIMWQTPSGRQVLSGQNFDHFRFDGSGTLKINNLVDENYGNYTCIAKNTIGKSERSVYLRIKSLNAHIIVLNKADTFVTLTWKDVDHASEYQIIYGETGVNSLKTAVNLEPYMKSYTVADLTPRTQYNICIKFKEAASIGSGNCKKVTTENDGFSLQGLTNLKQYIVGVAIGCTCFALTSGCIVYALVRRYNRKLRLQGESRVELFSSSAESLSSGIMYENTAADVFTTQNNFPRADEEAGPSGATSRKCNEFNSDSDDETEEKETLIYETIE